MRRTGILMIVLGWLLLGGVVWLAMDGWVNEQEAPNARVSMVAGEVVLQRNRAGHYLAPGEINDVPVTFLVDTGATGVALSSKVADAVGAQPGLAMRTATARGETVSYATRLDSVSLGGMTAHDVAGTIVPEMTDDTVLLGMSFLSRFQITMRDGEMRLLPY
jgi:aspartyl protease family protein